MQTSVVARPVLRFCHQYLQAEPLLDYPDGKILRDSKTQEYLYETLFSPPDSPHAVFQGLPPDFVWRVLKTLVNRIEASIEDWDEHGISDNLMDSLARLATSNAGNANNTSSASLSGVSKYTVAYFIAALADDCSAIAPPQITLSENRMAIAATGTTGFRTWEAALHLGAYLCQNRHLIRHKSIVELGAGTGYVSILCAKYLGARRCIATDGSDLVVDGLQANFRLNGLDYDITSARKLLWGQEGHSATEDGSFGTNGQQQPDVILGADITFDVTDMPALLTTIQQLSSSKQGGDATTILISATERNRVTFEAFLDLAGQIFRVERIDFPVQSRDQQQGPFYSDAVPIHICRLEIQ